MSTALRVFWPDSDDAISVSPNITLTAFYRSWYAPAMAGRLRRRCTIAQEEESLRLWVEYTGDPPVSEITQEVTSAFVAALAARRTRRGSISANTIRKHIRTLQPILDRLGPPGPRLRIASGILDIPPVLPMPKAVKSHLFKAFVREEIRALLTASDGLKESRATQPVPTALWWRCAVILAYNTALRIGSLLAMRWEYFDGNAWAILPPETTKTGQQHLVYCNAEARRALSYLRRFEVDAVLPWRGMIHSIHNARRAIWNRLLPQNRRWGFHAIRKATLTWAASINPMIARMIAGHSTGDTLRDHYVDPRSIAHVLDQLPPLEPGPESG